MKMKYHLIVKQARDLNRKIFETIYYGALNASCDLAANIVLIDSYQGSPISEGKLQFDMWDKHIELSDDSDWIGIN